MNRPAHGVRDATMPSGYHVRVRPEWDWSMMYEVGPNLWVAQQIYAGAGRRAWACSRVVGMT